MPPSIVAEHDVLSRRAAGYLHELCIEIPTRRVGSAGNRAATDHVARVFAAFGFAVEQPGFPCIDWETSGARLTVGSEAFAVQSSPYSRGCRMSGPLVAVSTLAELAAAEAATSILLVRGELAKEQLMPKNFPFYNPDEHRQIIALLEEKQPLAIVAATTRNPELAGALYPFPLIEDGDFDIPSVYMTEDEGNRLARRAGQPATVTSEARRIPAAGCNVTARAGASGQRIVICAHIDAKLGAPGALDNAAGVTVLLLLAGLLQGYSGAPGLELVAINGEDYYSAPGGVLFLQQNRDRLAEIVLAINIDGAGYHKGQTAYSLYQCPDEQAALLRRTLARHAGLVEGSPWYQGDHMMFVMSGRPALALTSEQALEIAATIAHTEKDRPELVDCSKLAQAALALRDLIGALSAVRSIRSE